MDFITKIKETRKNLHYVSAVSRTKPVDKIPVDSSKMAKLDLSIKEKCRQNHLMDHIIINDEAYYCENKSQQGPVLKKRL